MPSGRAATSRPAAFLGDFPPGQCTAIISGKNGSTGVGIVEVFKLLDL